MIADCALGDTYHHVGMPFSTGDHVHVQSLGKGIVREVRGGERYLVEIKGRSLIVPGIQLSLVDARKVPRRPEEAPSINPPSPALPSRGHVPASLDLHGMTTEEADAALAEFLSDAILAGHPEVRVIHGRSGGRLKAAVHARLRQTTAVRAFRLEPRNPGVTLVQL
jgi:dsDNA-specific endonuclease/ATPase MutS2